MASNRILRNTFALYGRSVVTLVISLFTSRITLDALGINDWGLYSVVGGFTAMFAFLNSSLSLTIQRFLTVAIAKGDDVGNVLSHSIKIMSFIALVIIILIEIIGPYYIYHDLNVAEEKRNLAFWVFQLSVISVTFSTITIPFTAILTSYERLDIFAYIEISNSIIRLSIVYLLYLFNDRLLMYALYGTFVYIVVYCLYRLLSNRLFEKCRHRKFNYNKELLKKLLSFSAWTTLSSICMLCRDQMLAVIYNIFFGLVVNAAYGIAMQVNAAVSRFTSSIVMAFIPVITKEYTLKDYEKTKIMLISSSKFASLLLVFLFIPIFFEMDFVLSIWLIKVPEYTSIIIKMVICSSLIICLFGNNAIVIRAAGNVALFEILTSICNALYILVIYFSLKNGGTIYDSLIVMIITTIVQVLFQLYLTVKILPMRAFSFIYEVLVKLVLSCIFPCIVCYYLSLYFNGWLEFFSVVIMNTVLLLICSYFIYFNNNEKLMMKALINKIIKRK